MKKIIALALSVLMIFSCLVACGDEGATQEGGNVKDAAAFLENMYQKGKKGEVMEMLNDTDVVTSVVVDKVTYNVEWAVTVTEGASDAVKVGKSEKENCVLIDVPEVPEKDILFTATATVKDKDDNKETVSFSYKVPGTGMSADENKLSFEEILTQAYALEKGKKMEGTHSLTGKITKIDTPYDASYKNITVTITVDGFEDKPMQCYRLEGEGADKLAVGDYITVTGTITNYEGKIQFEAKCTVSDIVKGEGDAPSTEAVTDVAKIMKDAKALAHDAKLPYTSVLEGTVIAVDEKYSEEFKNVTVTIEVKGYADTPVKCYRLTGAGIEKIEKNDTITVSGVIKKYNQIIEFDSGCTLTKRLSGGGVTKETDPAKIMEDAYKLENNENLGYEVTLEGKVKSIDTPYSEQYDNISVWMVVAGKDLLCYRLKGNGIKDIVPGDTITVTGMIKNYSGKIEFDQGCIMRKREATGQAVTKPTDPKKIVDAAFALEESMSLPYSVTLTGKIKEIETPYNEQYKNISVIIVVEGTNGEKDLLCYRIKGDGAQNLKVGDTITVTGTIKNHYGTIEFNSGSTFVKK